MLSACRFLFVLARGVILLGLAAPAQAAFPGENGHIAFESEAEGNGEIFVMKPDGSAQTNLANNPDDPDVLPSYSPDGRRIAFSRYFVAETVAILGVPTSSASDELVAWPVIKDEDVRSRRPARERALATERPPTVRYLSSWSPSSW